MALSVKNLTHALSEVRGVYECDSFSRRYLFSPSPILGASDCLPIRHDREIGEQRVENEATVHENA